MNIKKDNKYKKDIEYKIGIKDLYRINLEYPIVPISKIPIVTALVT